MNILENELVRKYFASCEHSDNSLESRCLCRLNYAGNVLQAMQEPIRDGDKFLLIGKNEVTETSSKSSEILLPYHPYCLHLPHKFQKRECFCTPKPTGGHVVDGVCECPCHKPQNDEQKGLCFVCAKGNFSEGGVIVHKKCVPNTQRDEIKSMPWGYGTGLFERDEVEEKIKGYTELLDCSNGHLTKQCLESHLRELVRLARETK